MTSRGRRGLGWLALALVAIAAAAAGAGWWNGLRLGLYRVARQGQETILTDLGGAAEVAAQPAAEAAAQVDNLILVVGDGLGFSQLTAARNRLEGLGGRLFIERFPVAGWTTVHSAATAYVDSASSASALATGVKTDPRWISSTPDGRSHRTLLEAAVERGMASGLVTSSIILDATPAAFASHAADRGEYLEIARQMAGAGVELLISETGKAESEEGRARLAEVEAVFDGAGFARYADWERLRAEPPAEGESVLALLPPGSITADRSPALADIADFAIDRLAGRGGGFFLLVEDEDTDSGAHAHDLPRVIRAIADLDAVARRAVEFARRDERTLVLVLSDHETGGLTLLGGADGEPLRYRWITPSHTVGPVPLFAWGPGAERFGRVLDNTDVPRIVASLLGLDWPQPATGDGAAAVAAASQ